MKLLNIKWRKRLLHCGYVYFFMCFLYLPLHLQIKLCYSNDFFFLFSWVIKSAFPVSRCPLSGYLVCKWTAPPWPLVWSSAAAPGTWNKPPFLSEWPLTAAALRPDTARKCYSERGSDWNCPPRRDTTHGASWRNNRLKNQSMRETQCCHSPETKTAHCRFVCNLSGLVFERRAEQLFVTLFQNYCFLCFIFQQIALKLVKLRFQRVCYYNVSVWKAQGNNEKAKHPGLRRAAFNAISFLKL